MNKDSYLILDTLPAEYDSRVKAMEVDEKPTEDYSDIGGLDKQIQELREAVVLPMTHADKFKTLGIRAPKGVLLYGPPGTGKTLIARACAAQTNAAYLKLAGPLLVQMFIGDGAKLVRDAFALAKEKAPAIIFIDEIDAIGTKRFDSDTNGDREVQRTMLELLNQLDGFSSDDRVKIIAATNRADILDPALLRSGRLDRKIEFPHPNEDARAQIMEIHAQKDERVRRGQLRGVGAVDGRFQRRAAQGGVRGGGDARAPKGRDGGLARGFQRGDHRRAGEEEGGSLLLHVSGDRQKRATRREGDETRTRRRGSDGRRAVSASIDETLDSRTRSTLAPRDERVNDKPSLRIDYDVAVVVSLVYCTLRERCSASNVR